MLSTDKIAQSHDVIPGEFKDTPLFRSERLSAQLDQAIWLKVETVNPIGCFKGRGVSWWMAQNPGIERVACITAGNFGQAVAYAGRATGATIDVFTIKGANPSKIDAMRKLGAEVHQPGATYAEVNEPAARFAERTGAFLLIDGMEDEISEGAGTIALEITARDVGLDVLFVPLGDGGLINGIGTWMRSASPQTKVIGVCAEGAPAMLQSWQKGDVVRHDITGTIADGIAIEQPIARSFDRMLHVVDDVVAVSDKAMREAMKRLYAAENLIVEPSAAAGLAAIAQAENRDTRQTAGIIVTGSNIDPALRTQMFT